MDFQRLQQSDEFLDADDAWVNDFYKAELVEQLQTANADVFRFSYYEANEQLTRGRLIPVVDAVYEDDIPLYGGHFCSYIYKADLVNKYQLRFPIGIKLNEDCVFLYIFLSISSRVIYKKETIFMYRSNLNSVVHQKRDVSNDYLDNIIPAWEWAKEKLKKMRDIRQYEKSVSGCDTMKKTYLSEYVQSACRRGIKIHQIQSKLQESNLKILYDDTSIWVDGASLKFWESFHKSPRKTWIKCRIKNICLNGCKKLFRNSKWLIKRRYPSDLSQVYFEKEHK